MKFRNTLFLAFSVIIATVLLFQWILMNTLSRDLTQVVDETAIEVGENLAKILVVEKSRLGTKESKDAKRKIIISKESGKRVIILPDGHDLNNTQTLDSIPGVDIEVKSGQNRSIISIVKNGEVTRIPIPNQGLDRTLKQSFSALFLGIFALFVFGLSIIWLVANYFAKPLEQLSQLAAQLGSGVLGVQAKVPAYTATEVRQTFNEFNKMSTRLEDLQNQNQRLSQLAHLSELGDIGRGLAHSLRNPLHTIGLLAESIVTVPALTDRRKSSQGIFYQIGRIDRLIRSFMALHQQDGLAAQQVNINHIIQDLILELRASSSGHCQIKVTGPEGTLLGIEAEIRIVLQTLLTNSIEAGATTVEIRIIPSPEALTIEVEDDGRGIDSSLVDQLFQPHITTKTDGAGMGLFLASRIIEYRYQGKIEFSSIAPKGTIAVVRLKPRSVTHDQRI